MDEFWFYGSYGNKLFLPNQSISIMYPNKENMIMVPNHKTMKIIIRIQVCLIWWMNFHSMEIMERKDFPAKPKHQYHVSQWGANHKKNEDYYENHVCLFWWMNFDSMEIMERKAFLPNQSISIMYPNVEKMIAMPNHKKIKIITVIMQPRVDPHGFMGVYNLKHFSE